MASFAENIDETSDILHEKVTDVTSVNDDKKVKASSTENVDICNILQQQIDDIIFVDDDTKLKGYLCVSCGYVAISHCIANCSDVFCTRCYQIYFRRHCPFCKAILASNNHYDEFEAEVLQLKVECKFTNNRCKEIVLLRNFLKHAKSCRFSTEKIKPKLYKTNVVNEALEKLTNDISRIEEEIKSMQIKTEQRIKDVSTNAIHDKFKKAQEMFDDKLQKLTKSTEALHKEVTQIKEMVQKCEEASQVLQDQNKNNFEKTKVDFITELKILNAVGFQKLTDDEHYKKIALEAEIKQIKEDLRKTEDGIKEEINELRASSRQMATDITKQNKIATDWIQTEITGLKSTLRERENKMNKQIKQEKDSVTNTMAKEIRRLETRIQESKTQMDKTKKEHQSEIQTLKSEHKEELRVMESQQEGRLEILEKQVTVLQYHHEDDGGDILPDIFIWKITGITKIMKELVENKPFTYVSEKHFTNQNGEQFKPDIYTVKDYEYVNINLHFFGANNSEPYLHSRRFFLIDQSTSMRKNNVELIDRPECKMNSAKHMMSTCLSNSLFFPPRLLQGKSKYVKNDAIIIKIIFEPIAFLWKQIVAQDGVFLWRISDYSKKKRDEIDGVKRWLASKPFKTSQLGYMAHLELYLNGYGNDQGKYISMYLRFLLGEHDDSLTLPFNCKRTFFLIDQSESPSKENIGIEYTYKFKEGAFQEGVHHFALQSTVESSKYLKNDSIVIQVTLKIL